MQDVRAHHALVCPRIAELYLLIDYAVGLVFLRDVVQILLARNDIFRAHRARALVNFHIMLCKRIKRMLSGLHGYLFPAGQRAEAVAVGYHQRAAAFDELRQIGVIDLAAHDGDSGPEGGLGVGLALLQLLQRFPQVREDQVLGTGEAHQIQHMELVARDNGIFGLAHLADLADDGTDLVVLRHGLADGGIGGIHTVFLRQRIQYAAAHLFDIGIQRVVRHFVRDVAVGDKEVGLVIHLQDLEVLHGAVHHGAGIHAGQRVQELVAALHAALHQRAGILAGVVGHVIGGDV